jgi:type II secretory pathway component PulF
MMQFSYRAMSMDGQSRQGIASAGSPMELRRILREQGLALLSAQSIKATSAGRVSHGRSGISKNDLLQVTSQFAIMAQAGVDVASALQMLSMECSHPKLRRVLVSVHERVSSGESIAEALQSHREVFGESYIASVAAGEASGKLALVLGRLTQLLRADIRLVSTIRSLMAYPLILLVVSTSVMTALVFFVLPTFADVFAKMGIPLPTITQVLLDGSSFVQFHGIWVGLGVLGVVAGLVYLAKLPAGRLWMDRTLLRVPVVKGISRPICVGRSFRLLGTMIESGVPLLESLGRCEEASSNLVYRELFRHIKEEVINGRSMSGALSQSPDVPAAAASMVATGERTGNLGTVLQLLGEHYESDAESRFKDLATYAEPAMVIFVGAIVAVVVLSLVIPMFDFTSAAGAH